jgi:hypothetical protein
MGVYSISPDAPAVFIASQEGFWHVCCRVPERYGAMGASMLHSLRAADERETVCAEVVRSVSFTLFDIFLHLSFFLNTLAVPR